MVARYAYWRTPGGDAYRGNDDKHAPRLLLENIGRSAEINEEGKVAWRGWPFLRFEPAVLGSIVILDPDGEELNRVDAAKISREAMRSLIKARGGSARLEPGAVMKAANTAAATHFRKPSTKYVLVTTVSVRSFPVKRLSVGNCQIEAIPDRSRYLLPEVLQNEQRFGELPKTKHPYVRVSTSGRSHYEAFDRGMAALLRVCALWNLFATLGAWSIKLSGRRRNPIGVVHVGPIHTLHTPDGKPVDDYYWYERDYAEVRQPFAPEKGWEKIEKNRRWAMARIRQLPYSRDLHRLLLRYSAALSTSDPDAAFLQMWGMLETITDTVGRKYDDTIRRATWIWKGGDLASEVLGYLRCFRNQYVHSARSSDGSDQVALLMKSFIDPHLLALLRNDLRVQTLAEYASCLSLPTSIADL
ncbi:MAG: hypothetical protein WCI75_13495 [candidate division NC10 bacterium]